MRVCGRDLSWGSQLARGEWKRDDHAEPSFPKGMERLSVTPVSLWRPVVLTMLGSGRFFGPSCKATLLQS
eukprot:g45765.t1